MPQQMVYRPSAVVRKAEKTNLKKSLVITVMSLIFIITTERVFVIGRILFIGINGSIF